MSPTVWLWEKSDISDVGLCEKKYDWERFEFCCLSASKYCLWPNGRSIFDLINGSFTHGLSFGGYRGRQISTLIIQLHKVGYKERANRVHMSCDIVWLFWQFDILYCKKTCLSSRLSALRFRIVITYQTFWCVVYLSIFTAQLVKILSDTKTKTTNKIYVCMSGEEVLAKPFLSLINKKQPHHLTFFERICQLASIVFKVCVYRIWCFCKSFALFYPDF